MHCYLDLVYQTWMTDWHPASIPLAPVVTGHKLDSVSIHWLPPIRGPLYQRYKTMVTKCCPTAYYEIRWKNSLSWNCFGSDILILMLVCIFICNSNYKINNIWSIHYKILYEMSSANEASDKLSYFKLSLNVVSFYHLCLLGIQLCCLWPSDQLWWLCHRQCFLPVRLRGYFLSCLRHVGLLDSRWGHWLVKCHVELHLKLFVLW